MAATSIIFKDNIASGGAVQIISAPLSKTLDLISNSALLIKLQVLLLIQLTIVYDL